ncbi:MAG: LysR substrate-binding domain-containing protein [Desulfobacterales bacterium]|nr:LysR substrate-binding domain-containing protein [Desulfobacterales bacterium]
MNIAQLKTLIAVVETGNFTHAAKTVHLTQSAVSLQIKRLEEELGETLLHRDAKTIKPTGAGKDLLLYARELIRIHDEAILSVSRREHSGHIRIGAPEDYISPFLTRIFSRFSQDYPRVKVAMVSKPSVHLKKDVDQADLDFALCTEMQDGGKVLFREPMVWVSSPRHRQHETKDQVPLAVSYEGCPYRRWSMGSLEAAGREFRINYTSPTSTGIMAGVRAGFAVAIMGITNIPDDLMIIGEAQGFPNLPMAHITLHRAPKPSSPLMLAFENHIRDIFKEVQSQLRDQLNAGERVWFG